MFVNPMERRIEVGHKFFDGCTNDGVHFQNQTEVQHYQGVQSRFEDILDYLLLIF